MRIKTTFFIAMIFAALTFAVPAVATEVLTSSYPAWFPTTTGSAPEWDFNIPNNTYDTASGYNLTVGSYGPLNVTAPDGGNYNLQKGSYTANGHSFADLAGPGDGIGSMNFTTQPAGLTAIGIGLGITGNAAPITITLSDGETFTANPAVNGLAFVGLSSSTPITSFVLTTSSGSSVQITDFFAAISNEPASDPDAPAAEVTTALMIGTGLLAFGARRRVFSNLSRRLA
jgi:hypothetical protein